MQGTMPPGARRRGRPRVTLFLVLFLLLYSNVSMLLNVSIVKRAFVPASRTTQSLTL